MGEVKNDKKGVKKVIIIVSSILIFLVLGSIVYFYSFLSSLNHKNNGKMSITPKEVKSNEPINILLLGVDIGEPGKAATKVRGRTDTMMVVNYNILEDKLSIVSIPRDTLITLNNKREKINAAHAIGGVKASIDAVENLLGIDINYYAMIDYSGFRELVDALGGIDMDITRNMNYDDPSQNLSIHFKKGEKVHLDGKKAEEFFRWRKNNDGTGFADGDLGRIQNQHLFIKKVMEKVKSPTTLVRIPKILKTIPKYMDTNMEADSIIKYGYKIKGLSDENIKTATLKGEAKYIKGISYFIYNKEKNKEILSTLKSGKSNGNKINKDELKLQVLNCTNKTGLAKSFSAKLNNKGYNNIEVGNGKKIKKSKITFYGINNDEAEKIKNEFNIDNVEINSTKNEKFDIIVLLGEDTQLNN